MSNTFDVSQQNGNLLARNNFKFEISRCPTLSTMIQSVDTPSLQLPVAGVPTLFSTINQPGDKLEFGDVMIRFKLDENMLAYFEIYDWMVENGFPSNFTEYQSNPDSITSKGKLTTCDAILTVMDNRGEAFLTFTFLDVYPSIMDQLDFDTTVTDIDYMTCTATFSCKLVKINRIKTVV